MPAYHQDAEYSPNHIYIYIYETAQLEPALQCFSTIIYIYIYKDTNHLYIYIYMQIMTIYIYIYIESYFQINMELSSVLHSPNHAYMHRIIQLEPPRPLGKSNQQKTKSLPKATKTL